MNLDSKGDFRSQVWIRGAVNVSIVTCPATMRSVDHLTSSPMLAERMCDTNRRQNIVRYHSSNAEPGLLVSLSEIGEALWKRSAKKWESTDEFLVTVAGDDDIGLQHYISVACDIEHNLVNEYFMRKFKKRVRFEFMLTDDPLGLASCSDMNGTNSLCFHQFFHKSFGNVLERSSVVLMIQSMHGILNSLHDHTHAIVNALELELSTRDTILGIISPIIRNDCWTMKHEGIVQLFTKSKVAFADYCSMSMEEPGFLEPQCIPWLFDSGDSILSLVHRQVFHQLASYAHRISTAFGPRRKLLHRSSVNSRSGKLNQQRQSSTNFVSNVNGALNRHRLDNSSIDYTLIESRAKILFEKDPYTPLMLSVLDELLLRKSPEWFASRDGIHIKSGVQLTQRLEFARKKHGRDCRRENALLLMCVITKNDDVDLQEWLVWQIMVVGAHHIIVYVNIPVMDNTREVLKAFEEAGYVSVVEVRGSGKQPDVYDQCVHTIRRKVCHYPGYGPLAGNGSDSLADCTPHEDPDVYMGKDRVVWLSAFDSDEFALSMDGACMIDELGRYDNYNGLMIPWFCMGHSQHFLTPKDTLVTEAYTHRMPGVGGLDKAFNRFYCIDHLPNSHAAVFKNKQMAVDEFFNYSNYEQVGKYPARHFKDQLSEINATFPKYRLYHYMTKSVEHLVKKWSRGMADYQDQWGRSMKRPLDIIIGWLKGFAMEWKSEDQSALEMAKVVRTVLYG